MTRKNINTKHRKFWGAIEIIPGILPQAAKTPYTTSRAVGLFFRSMLLITQKQTY